MPRNADVPPTALCVDEFPVDESPVNDTEICLINIGPKQRRMRAASGVVGLAIAMALAVGLAFTDLAVGWRAAAVFVPVYGGLLGILQARAKT